MPFRPSAPCLTTTDTSNSNRTSSAEERKRLERSFHPSSSPSPPPPRDHQLTPSAPPVTASTADALLPPPPAWLLDEHPENYIKTFPDFPDESLRLPAPIFPPAAFSSLRVSKQRMSNPANEGKDQGFSYQNTHRNSFGDVSIKNRMGDYQAVEVAVEEMGVRMRQREVFNAHLTKRPDLEKDGFDGMSKRSASGDVKYDGMKTVLAGVLGPSSFFAGEHNQCPSNSHQHEKFLIDVDELDMVLLRVNEKPVSYYRCEEPEPDYVDQMESRVAVRTPDCQTKSSKTRSCTRRLTAEDLQETRKTLQFDSGNKAANLTDGKIHNTFTTKNRRVPRQQTNGVVQENRRGQIVFRTDAQRGYEFSSTISVRASDLNKYTVTQTRREIRTGRTVTSRKQVFGAGITQQIIWDDDGAAGRYRHEGFDDSLTSLSYDESSQKDDVDGGIPNEGASECNSSSASSGMGSMKNALRTAYDEDRNYKDDKQTFLTNTPFMPSSDQQQARRVWCCFPFFRRRR